MINKSWDPIWEKIFSYKSWGQYPPEELIRFASRNFYQVKDRKKIKFLDLGCGPGAASWYISREGFSVCGIDGSETAIKLVQSRFAEDKLLGEFKVGDIVKIDYPSKSFDVVIDICSVQHNSTKNINLIISEIHRVLKNGGRFFGIMIAEDKSLVNWPGQIHFFQYAEIKKLFKKFKEIGLEYTIKTKSNQEIKQKFWIVEAIK